MRPRALALWERVLQHGEQQQQQQQVDPVVLAETHTDIAVFLQHHGTASDLASAISHVQQAIDLYKDNQNNQKDKDNSILPALAASHLHQALLHQQAQQWSQALAAFAQGVSLQQQVLGEAHAAVADTYQNMGHLHGQMQQFDQAVQQYQKALDIYHAVLQTTNDKGNSKQDKYSALCSIAGAHHNIGIATQYQAQHQVPRHDKTQLTVLLQQALEALQTALRMRHETLGPHHADTAASHLALASFLSSCQQTEAATEHYQAAADVWRAMIGHDDYNSQQQQQQQQSENNTTNLTPSQLVTARRHLATVYNNKGATQQGAGNVQAALEDYLQAQQALAPLLEQSQQQGVQPSLMLEWVATHNSE